MKLIQQSHEIWGECPTDYAEALRLIERCGRVCYASEDKITEDSAEPFVTKLVNAGHLAMIEHSCLVIKSMDGIVPRRYPYATTDSSYLVEDFGGSTHYIAGNYRAWMEDCGVKSINEIAGGIISRYEGYEVASDIPNDLKRITVKFTTNRAMSHELVRHRPCSFAQVSQRYVRYSEGVDLICPVQWDSLSDKARLYLVKSWAECEECYTAMLDEGCPPQVARNVLSHATATKIIVTADIPEWNHIFNLRCAKSADPQMQNLMIPVRDEFKARGWIA